MGRIPRKIDIGEGFSNFTADQWRTFFTIYATVALWDHLMGKDRRILTHFVRVCKILVSRIMQIDLMKEAHQRLIEIVKLIEEHYGRDKITPNLHLSLHLCECSYDFGPLYTFWCFSFERMNGILGTAIFHFFYYRTLTNFLINILGSLPNSHRQIELELMCRLTNNIKIESIISS
ncbi:MAG TPA: hypothetical protein VJ250_04250, partial [Nitrososphaeraceae archaeon]|nr:hypothetical protein [Nitrososphaeraceae archaeon]